MTARSESASMEAGMRRIEAAVQALYDTRHTGRAGAATVSFDWKGGQPGGDIPIAEAVTLEAYAPAGNGKLALRRADVEASADALVPGVQHALQEMVGKMR